MYMRISMRSQIKDPLAQSIVYACSDAEDEKSVCLSFENGKKNATVTTTRSRENCSEADAKAHLVPTV